MKLQRGYLIVAVCAVLAVLFTYAIFLQGKPPEKPKTDDDFLAEVRARAATDTGSGEALAMLPGSESGQGFPVIALSAPRLDLGVVSNKEHTVVDFPIFNKGDGELVITNVSTSCQCTQGAMPQGQQMIKPGGQGILKVTFHPELVPGFDSHKVLSIFSNDLKNRVITLDVSARVEPEFSLDPETVTFGDIPKGQPASKTVIVRQESADPFEITGLSPQRPQDSMELAFERRLESEWAKPGRTEFVVKVTLPADLPAGQFTSGLFINNTAQRVKRFPVPVSANVTAFYTVSPQRLLLGAVELGKEGAGTITVQADRAFEVADLAVKDPDFVVTSKPGDEPNTIVLSLNVNATAKPGRKQSEITFTVKAGQEAFHEKVSVQLMIPNIITQQSAAVKGL